MYEYNAIATHGVNDRTFRSCISRNPSFCVSTEETFFEDNRRPLLTLSDFNFD